jgi:hypothetical protein
MVDILHFRFWPQEGKKTKKVPRFVFYSLRRAQLAKSLAPYAGMSMGMDVNLYPSTSMGFLTSISFLSGHGMNLL